MKLMHLSDLHLGKRLLEVSLLEDQAYILDRIIEIVDTEQPDAVLICGDVNDKTIPPAEAVQLFDDFLNQLAQRKKAVFVISGNHDSAERLAFGGRLMDPSGIHIAPVYDGKVEPVTLRDEFGAVNFYMLPFVKPASVRRLFPEESIESYTDAVAAAIRHMDLEPEERSVLLTHQFVMGAGTFDSEERSIGGTDQVDGAVFAPFDYVALGHLHGPQNISAQRIRYCGTPLKYSFSEAGHQKSVSIVQLGAKGSLTLRTVGLHPRRELRRLRGSYAQMTDRSFYQGTAVDDYLQITLTDDSDVPEAMGRLRAVYPNLLRLDYDNARTRSGTQTEFLPDTPEKTPLEYFEDLYRQQNNQPMGQEQRQFMQDLIGAIQEEEA